MLIGKQGLGFPEMYLFERFHSCKPDSYSQVFLLKSGECKILSAADVLWHVTVPGVQIKKFPSMHLVELQGHGAISR